MADMFPGANAIGDSIQALFSPQSDTSAAYYKLNQENRLFSMQNMGVQNPSNNKANIAGENSSQYGNEKNKPSPTEDPMEVEARWTARLAKYAGIATATGVKMGGL